MAGGQEGLGGGGGRLWIQGRLRAVGAAGGRGVGREWQPGSHFNHFNWPLGTLGNGWGWEEQEPVRRLLGAQAR